jgi:hypothetical protein
MANTLFDRYSTVASKPAVVLKEANLSTESVDAVRNTKEFASVNEAEAHFGCTVERCSFGCAFGVKVRVDETACCATCILSSRWG